MEVRTGSLTHALRHPYVNIPPLHRSVLVHPAMTLSILPLRQDFAVHTGRVIHNGHDPWVDHTFRSNHSQNAERVVVIAVGVCDKTTLANILERRFGTDNDMHTRVFQALIEDTNQAIFL